MDFILKNVVTSTIVIKEIGLKLKSGETFSLEPSEVDTVSVSEDLIDYLNSGSIVLNDGTKDLSASEAIEYLRRKPDLENYYVKNEVDNLVSNKSDKGHTHTEFYTRDEVDNIVSSSGSYGIKGSVDTYTDLESLSPNDGEIYIVKETMGDSPNSWMDGWNKRLRIKINKDHIHGDLTEFPVYLDLSKLPEDHPFWTNVKSDGSDIRITDSNNNQLPLEVVSFSNTNFQQGLKLSEWHNVSSSSPDNHGHFISMQASSSPAVSQIWSGDIYGEGDSPIGNVSDNFSLKFEGYIYAPVTGPYIFSTDSDDASEIEVDNQVVVEWYGSHGKEDDWDHNGTKTLSKGYHKFVYRHHQGSGAANWRAGWAIPEADEDEIEVDDDDIERISASAFYTTANVGELWFRATLKPGKDNTFYLYYGNPAASMEPVDSTFGRNNVWTAYEAVYHMEEAKDENQYTAIDSTGKHNGIHDNSDPIDTNLIGKSMEYDGNDYTEITTIDTDDTWTGLTLTCWVNKHNSNWYRDQRFIDKSNSTNVSDIEFALMVGHDKNLEFRVGSDISHYRYYFLTNLQEHTWTKVTGTWDSISKKTYVYVDSQLKREFDITNGNHIETSNDKTYIGNDPSKNRGFDGILEEVRISKRALSHQWEMTEYDNQINSDSFYTVGEQEEEGLQNQSIPGVYTPTANTFVYMKLDGSKLNQIGSYQPSVNSQPEYETGLSGQCAVLDTDDYYWFVSNSFFGEGNHLSAGMFVYFTSFQTYDTLIDRYDSGGKEGYRFGLHDGKIELELGDDSDFLCLTSPNSIPLNEWVHIGFSYNDGLTKLYENAQLIESSTSFPGRINSNHKPLYINRSSSYGYGANVKLEDLFITNETLSQGDFESIVFGEDLEEYYREGFYQWQDNGWVFLAPNTSGSSTQHNSMQGLNQGDFLHLTNVEYDDLTGGESILHTHDDRYYTETEVDNKLSQKADSSHTHSNYYTKNEVDNLIDSIDYDTISNNDSSTNVTGAELEQLTNGSNADGLHTHSGGGGSGSGGLDDAYDNHSEWSHGSGREIEVDFGPVTLDAKDGYAPFHIKEIDYVPNKWLSTGHMCVYDGELFIYDATRSCWNSVSGYHIGGGVNSNNVKNTYLKGFNGTSFTDDVGWVAPWDGVVVSMAGSSNNDTHQAVELRKNGNSTSAKIWYNGNKKVWANWIDVKFSEGDVLNFYASEHENGLDRPQAWAIIKRRIS